MLKVILKKEELRNTQEGKCSWKQKEFVLFKVPPSHNYDLIIKKLIKEVFLV